MAKDTYYFSHDHNARNDKKISALVCEFKAAGYGIFWATCEMMHEEGGKLEFDELTIKAIAKDINEESEFVKTVIEKCIEKFKLFTKQGILLQSNRVARNLESKNEKKHKKAEAGRLGGIKSGESRRNVNNSEAKRSNASSNEPNKIKVKESKVKEIINTDVQGNVEKVKLRLHGIGDIEIDVFDKCESWQYKELKTFISGSQQSFESIAMNNLTMRTDDNFKIVLQAFVGMIQATNDYQESQHLRRFFGNWVAKKNGSLETFIQDIKKSKASKKLSVNDFI